VKFLQQMSLGEVIERLDPHILNLRSYVEVQLTIGVPEQLIKEELVKFVKNKTGLQNGWDEPVEIASVEGLQVIGPESAIREARYEITEAVRALRENGFGHLIKDTLLRLQPIDVGGMFIGYRQPIIIDIQTASAWTIVHEIGHKLYDKLNVRWMDQFWNPAKQDKDDVAMSRARILDVYERVYAEGEDALKLRKITPNDFWPFVASKTLQSLEARGDLNAVNIFNYLIERNKQLTKNQVMPQKIESLLRRPMFQELNEPPITPYAAQDAHEAFAEAFVLYTLRGPRALPAEHRALFERLTESSARRRTASQWIEGSFWPALGLSLALNAPSMPAAEQKAHSRAESMRELVQEAAQHHGIDHKLLDAVLWVESKYRNNLTSPKGAQGIVQMMPITQKEMGVKDPFNVEEAVYAAAGYLAKLKQRFGDDPALIAAAYNAGPKNVRRYDGIPPFKETQKYVKAILARMGIVQPNDNNRL